jgi:hypothetical protein
MFGEGGSDRRQFKLRGEWVELLFMARAAEHGLLVMRPWGDSSRHDFVVEAGGRFLRVQVKSTNFRKSKFYVCSMVRFGQKCYTSDDIDFFAIYVIPVDTWYFVPVGEAPKRTKTISLSPHNSLSKHACYREAWDLLRGE